ncbi:MAG TPA: hypothetical protein VK426_05980 [Methanobacterium sp.]|nr:hypothetical protein [Methanobacterium sp.]
MNEIFLEKSETKVSSVIRLVDDYSECDPIGKVDVSLKDIEKRPIKNISLYYVFIDLLKGIYQIQVKSDYYFDEYLNIFIDGDVFKLGNLHEIKLKPNFSYPFPNGATVIRGTVCDVSRKILSGASIKVIVKGGNGNEISNFETETSENGEFLFYFNTSQIKDFITKNNSNKGIKFEIQRNNQTIVEKEDLISKTLVIRCDGTYYAIS